MGQEIPGLAHSPATSSMAYLYNISRDSGIAVGNALMDGKDELKEQGVMQVLKRIGNLKRRATQQGRREQPIHEYRNSKAEMQENAVSNPSASGYQPE